MDDNLKTCPTCEGVVQDGVCTICDQTIKEVDSESDSDSACGVCGQPESKCTCGE